jgi:hypothetical protein
MPSRAAALDAIEAVRVFAPIPTQYQRRRRSDGRQCFVLLATVGVVLGSSPHYDSASALEKDIVAVIAGAGSAMTRDVKSSESRQGATPW